MVVIFSFLLSFINLNCYMTKKERYPRYYTSNEKSCFHKICLEGEEYDKKIYNDYSDRWSLKTSIKTMNVDFYFGGTPKERLYMKQTMEKINLLLKECNSRNRLVYLTSDFNVHESPQCWINNSGKIYKIECSKNGDLNLFISPNIKYWHNNEGLGGAMPAGVNNRSNYKEGSKYAAFGITNGTVEIYSNLYQPKDMNLMIPNEENYERQRINTFKHEMMHYLGFEHTDDSKSVMMKSRSPDGYPLIGFDEVDLVYIEMKYMDYFISLEPRDTFLKKLRDKENKMRRLDRRSRKEKLKYPI